MNIFILQRRTIDPDKGARNGGFQFNSAHQNIEGAKNKAQEYLPFGEKFKWFYSGFRWNAQVDEPAAENTHITTIWQIFETELEGYIPPQVEPLEFSPVPDIE